jgi:hypothetical protein
MRKETKGTKEVRKNSIISMYAHGLTKCVKLNGLQQNTCISRSMEVMEKVLVQKM